MLSSLQRWLPLALLGFAALWLRTHDLARRPMHADEANQAVKLGALLETGRYAYDPRDHHGPTLYYAALPVAWLRGERTLAALTEPTLRLVPALAGTAAVLLLAALAAPLGRWPALTAAALLAVSPPAVYYSRYFVQETLLAAFTLAALVAVARWWRTGRPAWAVVAGACLGLMVATKASAPLFVVAGLIGLAIARPARPAAPRLLPGALLATGTAVAVALLFFSSFGTHGRGVADAFAAFSHGVGRATGATGHEKPWWYYFALFGWQRTGGIVWQQLFFCGLALAGLSVAWVSQVRLARWAAAYVLVIAIVLSLAPYKTPWHAIHLVPGLALLAAVALTEVARLPTGRIVATLFACFALFSLAIQTSRACFQRSADPRNPYAYVHSSPDVLKYRLLAESALARHPEQPVRVIGTEYWPLPWYFRGLPRIGYWPAAPDDCDGALLVVHADAADAVRARLRHAYRETLLGLRPGVLCVVFTPTE